MKAIHSFCIILAAAALTAYGSPADASETDRRVESEARQSYVFRTYLQADEIKIQSRDGSVSLTGVVSENFHKSLAQETVAGLPGVTKVDNRLVVKGGHPTANSDAWLRDKVKVALLFHRGVSATATGVEVKDGIVTLRGEADSQSQKELATEYVSHVEGIKTVKNEMTLSSAPNKPDRTTGEKIDDASITAQVNMTLLNHRETSVLHTSVKTKRGVVSVGGKARNAAEKKLVTRLVADIHGVSRVNNVMTIE